MTFELTDECQKAFEDLKAYLASPLVLSPSKPDKEFSLYLAISPMAISSTLIREEDDVQLPMFYSSQPLKGAEERYPPMEKLAFSLITATRKLRPYFQAYTIVVQMNKPLRKIMNNPKAARQLVLWVIELSEFNI